MWSINDPRLSLKVQLELALSLKHPKIKLSSAGRTVADVSELEAYLKTLSSNVEVKTSFGMGVVPYANWEITLKEPVKELEPA